MCSTGRTSAKRQRQLLTAAAAVAIACTLKPWALAASESCPAEGAASERTRADPELNRLKNREQLPEHFELVSFEEILAWPAPPVRSAKQHRRRWPREQLEKVQKLEQRAVSLEGFLAGPPRLEGIEATNCYSEVARDIHMWVADKPHARHADSVVVELTPRVRAKHAAWSLKNLKRFAKDHVKVRISGWVMLDPEHPEQLKGTRASRATLYEIHPVLKIEVWSGGSWREL